MDSNLEQDDFAGEDPASKKAEKPKYFLVADDDEGDRLLLEKALEENNIHQDFRFVKSGVELVDLLNQSTGRLFSQAPDLPSLIILDLYMPRLDGHQVLKLIKDDSRFKKIPVIILTTSFSLADVVTSYNNGANSFLTKPLNYSDLVKLIGLVKEYWIEESHLPI
jgi:two-component system response regulator